MLLSRALAAGGCALGVWTLSHPFWPGGDVTMMTWPVKALTALIVAATLAAMARNLMSKTSHVRQIVSYTLLTSPSDVSGWCASAMPPGV